MSPPLRAIRLRGVLESIGEIGFGQRRLEIMVTRRADF
jgi:hypothetical protein